ncbi:hypothetical protein RFI_23487 [Reticulomyxa filosa]|uniref:EF-hand domain-containing protein n=1 Tax=Reticulomyxa filosa TaxID=46433 RepID=X6MLG8_RETFI|nr:hypothetical protein RFI_23487 [Reticulomyxa filosa]|eukprot:ETO13885.1 hypothetical protein RFI_23487 [Reticulomyxa filosa]
MTNSGPMALGSLSIEEELYIQGNKNPEHPGRYEFWDKIASALNHNIYHSKAFVVQRDLWYYFGISDNQQNLLFTKIQKMAKSMNEQYTQESNFEKIVSSIRLFVLFAAREWLLKRMELFEESTSQSNASQQGALQDEEKQSQQHKIQKIFDYLDTDKDGFINYQDLVSFLQVPFFKKKNIYLFICFFYRNENSHSFEQIDPHLLYSRDNMRIYPESWYYMCDQLRGDGDYKQGLTASHMWQAYLEYSFFDLDFHWEMFRIRKNVIDSVHSDSHSNDDNSRHTVFEKGTKNYNLYCDVQFNVPSPHLIVNHAIASGSHLYCHEFLEDPWTVTWDKLQEIQGKINAPSTFLQSKDKREIDAKDVMYYDPEEHTSEILAHLPKDHEWWHVVYECKLEDCPSDWLDNTLATYVKKQARNPQHRNELIEEWTYNRMEKYMQKWIWQRFMQFGTRPAYATCCWDDHRLLGSWKRKLCLDKHSKEENLLL